MRAGPLYEGDPLFLLLFTGNYQRQGGPSPQESLIFGNMAHKKTADNGPFRGDIWNNSLLK
jgi:hypothetical protein